jgi:hypothetical protein
VAIGGEPASGEGSLFFPFCWQGRDAEVASRRHRGEGPWRRCRREGQMWRRRREGQTRWRRSREKARLEERRLLLAPTAARGELPFSVEPLMRKDEKDRIR